MNITQEYRYIVDKMCEEFTKKYYTYDDWSVAEYDIIWTDKKYSPWTVMINDDYWSINQVYEALENDLPFERMQDWLYEEMEREWNMKVSFVNYCKYTCFGLDWMGKDEALINNK